VITTCEELQNIGGKEYDISPFNLTLEDVIIGVKVASMLSEW